MLRKLFLLRDASAEVLGVDYNGKDVSSSRFVTFNNGNSKRQKSLTEVEKKHHEISMEWSLFERGAEMFIRMAYYGVFVEQESWR